MKSSPTPSIGPHISERTIQAWLASDHPELELDPATLHHMEACTTCRERMESLAAPQDWWDRTSGYLKALEGDAPLSVRNSEVSTTFAATFLQAPHHPEMLGKVDHFDIEELIGQGGMGIVFRGFDRELNRAVAVKFLAPHLAANGTARQRFAREARAAAAIVHPNVVPIHAIAGDDRPYLVMALIGGPSLETLVVDQGPLDPVDVVRIGMQIAAGLEAAHRQGLVHRDIKPSNILLDGDAGRVLITDFGLARAADEVAVTQSGWLAGTPHYMSPEQTQGSDLDGRSDLFSLGSVLYYLATGREPFRGEQPLAVLRKIAQESPAPPRHINASVPTSLSRLIMKLLEKDPDQRFQTAQEAFEVLEKYLAFLQHPQTHPCPRALREPLLGISPKALRRISWIAGLIAILALVTLPLTWHPGTKPTPMGPAPSAQTLSAGSLDLDLPPWSEFVQESRALEESIRQMEHLLGSSP
jgi:eukaryotic-like serine/threonine-protein kinase